MLPHLQIGSEHDRQDGVHWGIVRSEVGVHDEAGVADAHCPERGSESFLDLLDINDMEGAILDVALAVQETLRLEIHGGNVYDLGVDLVGVEDGVMCCFELSDGDISDAKNDIAQSQGFISCLQLVYPV